MRTNLTLNLNVSSFNDDQMAIQISANQLLILPTTKLNTGEQSISFDIELPTKINIALSNRFENETEVDEFGKILQDKNIHLTSIKIFNTSIDSYKLTNRILEYKDNHDSIITPGFFWNVNGSVTITIDQDDPLVWLVKHQELW